MRLASQGSGASDAMGCCKIGKYSKFDGIFMISRLFTGRQVETLHHYLKDNTLLFDCV